MQHMRRLWDGYCLAALVVIAASIGLLATATPEAPPRTPDVRYEPTPQNVVSAMLELASVGANDVVYDLGCGDGRIVIAAAQRGARGVGVDIDPQRIAEANANARQANVVERVQFVQQDLFTADIRPATVVMLYLSPAVNLRLRPKLLRELQPGTRIVSHSHDMGDWKPEKTVQVGSSTLYYWVLSAAPAVKP
jgi:SAM-dependent methyltransferase